MRICLWFIAAALVSCATADRLSPATSHPLVIMTDYGLRDGAVSAMKGVAYQVEPRLTISDLTHEIPPYNVWEGAYRLQQTYKYWPAGTVFVTVVDPGVGSERRSIVVETNSGHIFVGPDNGLFTLVVDDGGLKSVRRIDEGKQRLKGSEESNTFHGRDLYVYVGARLAAGKLSLPESGELLRDIVRLNYQRAESGNGAVRGLIPVLDPNYGNVWTNIPKRMLSSAYPDRKRFEIKIFKAGKKVYEARLSIADTFAAVPPGQPLLYYNSLMNLALALNQADFAAKYNIRSGPDWTVTVSPEK